MILRWVSHPLQRRCGCAVSGILFLKMLSGFINLFQSVGGANASRSKSPALSMMTFRPCAALPCEALPYDPYTRNSF